MSEQDNEQLDALNLGEEAIQEPEMETTNSEVDVEALRAQAAKADEYKKYADRVAAENRKLKAKEQVGTEEQSINQSSSTDERFERLELKTEGYKDEEIDFLMRNGGKQALNDKLVMAAIETTRKSAKSQNATPSGTNKSPVYQKFTEKDLMRMPLEELEKIVPQD